MEKLWAKIKKSVVEGMTTAAEKTEEYTKIGKAKLDVLAVKRKITKKFTELGGQIYDSYKENKQNEAFESESIIGIIETLSVLDKELTEKESKLKNLTKTVETDDHVETDDKEN